MQTLVECGCGLDVHQAAVVARLLMVRKDGRVQKQMRRFGTTTRDLVCLREWLLSEGCTHLAKRGCLLRKVLRNNSSLMSAVYIGVEDAFLLEIV